MSHSHIPVRHLLKQLETYRSSARKRDIRPAWLVEMIDRISLLFEPDHDVARVGFECRLTEECWEAVLFLGGTEIVGGAEDGQVRLANFRFDLLTLIDNFSRVDHLEWHAQHGDDANPATNSFLEIQGLVEDQHLRLFIQASPPPEAGPGIRAQPNGQFEPV